MNDIRILQLIAILATAFFTGFTVGVNNKAYKRKFTMTQFFAEVLMHGVSGTIIGFLTTMYSQDIFVLCAITGVGAMFGQKLILIIVKRWLHKYIPSDKEEDIEDENNLM